MAVTLTARATDSSGNVSDASEALVMVVDTLAPGVPTLTTTNPSNTGTPVLAGTAEAGSTVIHNGDAALGQASVGAVGTYTFTPGVALADGTYSLTATATDAAENTSTAGVALSLVVDTVAPGVHVLSVTTPTNDNTPLLTGTAEAGARVLIYSGGALLGEATATDGERWFEPTTAMLDGNYSLTATATDRAGNTSEESDCGVAGDEHDSPKCRQWWCRRRPTTTHPR